jgi:hypothetical protein
MQRKKLEPILAAPMLPFTSIEKELGLVDNQEDCTLLNRLISKEVPGVLNQKFRKEPAPLWTKSNGTIICVSR